MMAAASVKDAEQAKNQLKTREQQFEQQQVHSLYVHSKPVCALQACICTTRWPYTEMHSFWALGAFEGWSDALALWLCG